VNAFSLLVRKQQQQVTLPNPPPRRSHYRSTTFSSTSFPLAIGPAELLRRHSSTRNQQVGETDPAVPTQPAIPEEWKGQVLQSLRHIIDPDLNQDIVSLGFIQNMNLDVHTRQVSFDVQLTTGMSTITTDANIQSSFIHSSFLSLSHTHTLFSFFS